MIQVTDLPEGLRAWLPRLGIKVRCIDIAVRVDERGNVKYRDYIKANEEPYAYRVIFAEQPKPTEEFKSVPKKNYFGDELVSVPRFYMVFFTPVSDMSTWTLILSRYGIQKGRSIGNLLRVYRTGEALMFNSSKAFFDFMEGLTPEERVKLLVAIS